MAEAATQLSFVIPCHNEEANLRALVAAIREAVGPLKLSFEIVVTDDCSTDNSWRVLKELAAGDPRVRGQRFACNCGQSAALWAGMKAARGQYIVTLDADLQNDPRDVPQFLEALKQCDCVCGSRVAARSQGDNFIRIASSHIANWVRNKLSGETISDAGCCYRAFKRECIENLKFFKGMHRFLPTLFRIEGYTVTEIPVRHNPRKAGETHYGVWNRLFASSYDLLAVRWMKKRMFRYEIAEWVN
jgi:glycosyltransferase involved in cell wall biosynthesis